MQDGSVFPGSEKTEPQTELQQIAGKLGELRTLAFAQGDMSRDRFVFEAIDEINQSVVS
jgi:hypothetical protein